MKKILFTLLAMSILMGASAQNKKCGIDTKALVAEQVAGGATHIDMLAKMAPNFDRAIFEKAGIVFGAQAGQIVTMSVPVEALPLLESAKEVIQYSISHTIATPECNNNRFDTRTDSVHQGLGVINNLPYDGEGVYIGITDWGFDYSHPNYNAGSGNLRLEMAWDHFKLSGPTPADKGYGEGLNYGTLITEGLRAAHGDTSNLYGYGTHGTHVAGITAGRGVDGDQMGQAPGAKLLFCSFGLGEKPWMDAVAWMKQVAQDSSRRLVVNSSWGMYSFSTIDGTSLLSQAINAWADSGIVFCTSGGNNGRTSIPFHISRTFRQDTVDTVRTVVVRASDIYSIHETGQVIVMWGEEGHDFSACIRLRKNDSTHWITPMFSTAVGDTVIYDSIVHEGVSTGYRVMIEHANPFDNRPHIQIEINKNSLQTQLFFTATEGTVHAWNIANKENHAGNEGCSFSTGGREGFTGGDALYGVGEPACAAKCISVAAHSADRYSQNSGIYRVGRIADFSSAGPLINGVNKPEISAPGVDVISSISYWTDDNYTAYLSKNVGGRRYIWSSMSGTSMSSPAVTGVVALMLQANPDLSVDQIREIIFTTARNDSITGPLVARDSMDVHWGWGKIDALRAVNECVRRVSINDVETTRIPLRVFPNPSSNKVTVYTGCGEQQMLFVYSIDGRIVEQRPVTSETTLDVSSWNQGIYILRVGSRTEKLIVNR
jgi:subtilisin family serine protease